tara:strand:- start:219 stop:530 length:312 start_codon:yes stop_codon:yes gene_type:complete
MNDPDTLLQAAINRLKVRLGEKIVNTAAEFAVIAENAPARLQKEWDLLKEEIFEEAERIKNENSKEEEENLDLTQTSEVEAPIDKIDQIRARVAQIDKKINRI